MMDCATQNLIGMLIGLLIGGLIGFYLTYSAMGENVGGD